MDYNSEARKLVSGVSVRALEERLRGAPYARLVQEHMRQGCVQVKLGIMGNIASLKQQEREAAEQLIDRYNLKGYSKSFWQSDCSVVFRGICDDFAAEISRRGHTAEDAAKFAVFQIVTMNFADMASEQKELRKFAGIRKSLFFR